MIRGVVLATITGGFASALVYVALHVAAILPSCVVVAVVSSVGSVFTVAFPTKLLPISGVPAFARAAIVAAVGVPPMVIVGVSCGDSATIVASAAADFTVTAAL